MIFSLLIAATALGAAIADENMSHNENNFNKTKLNVSQQKIKVVLTHIVRMVFKNLIK